MKGIVDRAFNVNLKVMRIFGFYPLERYKELYKAYAYAVYCLLIVPIPLLCGLYLLVEDNVDLAQISDNAFIICQSGCFIFKFLPFIRNEDEIRRCIYMLESSIFTMHTKKQNDIIEECIRICKRNSRFFLVYYITTFISWAFTPLFGNEQKFPVEIWLPFNPASGPKIFFAVFFYVVVGVGNGAISNSVINPLITGLSYYATAQIKVLKDNLENLGDYVEGNVLNFTKQEILYNKIKFCIEHHNAILNFIKICEETYSFPIFVQFLASIVVICITCLRLSVVEPFTVNFFSSFAVILAIVSEIYVFCYYGTTLFEESNTLMNAIYMGKWYDYDLKSKKALIILMERSKRPISVTAGKVLDLSLMTFTMILRRSYSLFAVLKGY